ncbi:hypothetical protein M7I_1810 [Glarea lozoyensis 74030]|uniref:Uncharacterized protein n=1 Tax=Glarea lozoyensis (strain ATCC 74030 / MF5533) TaxID=1104152 RepID=H0EGV2_GLAL7|nr:hypothetical protein M7I_1810 [Glarea lozoyensis 74030]
MKPPETPQDARRTSENIEHWGPPATRTRSLGLGAEIESGLEVVVDIDRDNEKMVVSQEEDMPAFVLPTSTASTKLMDCPITQDASFYRFGGFCDGAQLMIRGETGFKVVKRPSGHYSATVSARCVKCSYEVGWNDVEKDRLISRDGIYGNSGIRWRQKFISKCHIKTGSIEEPMYAVTSRAMGQATGTHNPKPTGRNARDPDGQYSLHFAVGARISNSDCQMGLQA